MKVSTERGKQVVLEVILERVQVRDDAQLAWDGVPTARSQVREDALANPGGRVKGAKLQVRLIS